MPEVIGGAVYEVDVVIDEASAAKAERRIKQLDNTTATAATGAQKRAFQDTSRGAEQLARSANAAATAQLGLRSAVRSSTTALASSVPLMGSFGTAAGSIAVAMPAIAIGVLGAAAGFQVLNAAVKRFTGSGIVDHLTGQAEAHKAAERAAKSQGEALENIARIQREGVPKAIAQQLEFGDVINDVTEAIEKREAALKRAAVEVARIEALRPPTPEATGTPEPAGGGVSPFVRAQASPALKQFDADMDQAIKRIVEMKLSYKELIEIRERFPDIAKEKAFREELEKQARAAGLAATALAEYQVIVGNFLNQQSLAAAAQKDLQDVVLGGINPQIEALKLEQTQLEQLKIKFGDAFDQQDRLDEVTRRLGLLTSQQDIVTASLALFAAEAQRSYGQLAPAAIERVAAALTALPEEKRIQVAVLLPDLSKIAIAFQNFLLALQAGASITVAVRLAAASAAPNPDALRKANTTSFLGGAISTLPGFSGADVELSETAQDLVDKWTETAEEVLSNAAPPLGAIADKSKAAGAAIDKAAKITAIWADGIIDLGEAMSEGLTPAMVTQLELTHDAELAVYRLQNAQFRANIEQQKAASGADVLRIALVNIAAELLESGRSAQQFLRDIAAAAIENARSVLGDIFGKPTRETLQLQLKLAEMERKRLLILQGGGTEKEQEKRLKPIDAEIEALRRAIALREKEFEIIRLKTELADKSIQKDIDVINSADFLKRVFEGLSGAALNATAALQDFAGGGGGMQFNEGEQRWINEIARQRNEPLPFPSLPALATQSLAAPLTSGTGESGVRMQQTGPLVQASFVLNVNDLDQAKREFDQQAEIMFSRARRGGTIPPQSTFGVR